LYYLFTKETLELHPIGRTYEELDWDALRPVESVAYEARDGMTIPSYLTQPAGKPPFPMVVLPHGGPTGRDFRRFDYVAQFLASRGYAILQPNFRGSTGYGASFLAAGRKQWGLAMQDDLEDGTRAMIDRGIADAERRQPIQVRFTEPAVSWTLSTRP
jgi:dipeptidyl aminopeptidase/acylaminoacyl peptidase